jgi:hypothetical protein
LSLDLTSNHTNIYCDENETPERMDGAATPTPYTTKNTDFAPRKNGNLDGVK